MSLFDQNECSVLRITNILGKKWIIFILSELINSNELFFNDLQERLKSKSEERISARILSLSLKYLEHESIVERKLDQSNRHVTYSLTDKGRELEMILGLIKGWSNKWDGMKFKTCKSNRCVFDSVDCIPIDKIIVDNTVFGK